MEEGSAGEFSSRLRLVSGGRKKRWGILLMLVTSRSMVSEAEVALYTRRSNRLRRVRRREEAKERERNFLALSAWIAQMQVEGQKQQRQQF